MWCIIWRATEAETGMDTDVMAEALARLEAWQQGDVAAPAPLLDPPLERLWWEPRELAAR
jgi:hypothetical protein